MRNELARKADREVLSSEGKPKTQNSELRTQNSAKPLFPAEEIEREMAADGLKISFVAGNHGRTDTARGQRDQHVECQFAKLVPLVVLTSDRRAHV